MSELEQSRVTAIRPMFVPLSEADEIGSGRHRFAAALSGARLAIFGENGDDKYDPTGTLRHLVLHGGQVDAHDPTFSAVAEGWIAQRATSKRTAKRLIDGLVDKS